MILNKKLNNKGFSLVELLAVLIILITILTIAIPSITSSVERNKENMVKKKYDLIEAAAESYVNQYKNSFQDFSLFNDGSCCLDIGDIIARGLLTAAEIKDADDNTIDGYVCYNKDTFEYNYSGNSTDKCLINYGGF